MIRLNGKLIHYQGAPNTFGSVHGPGLPTVRINGAPVALQGQPHTGHGSFPPSPSIEGSFTIRANGIGIMSFGDAYAPHSDGSVSHSDLAAPII